MRVNIDDYEVIGNGSLVVGHDQTVSFSIEDLTFKFDFIKDDSGVKKVVPESINGKTLLLHIFNFNNSLGTGISNLVPIATIRKQFKLFIYFAVYSISEEVKVFHYTWLTRPVKQEGGKDE